VSVPRTGLDHQVPLVRGKNRLESLAAASELQDVVLRFPPFMESWLALVGSELPLRGEPRATIGRPSPFLRAFRRVSGSTVERRGLMLVPGSPDNRNAFISVGDVARACVEAVERPEAAGVDLEVGGPEVLSWRDVATIYGDVLGRRVRTVSTPAGVYAAAASALRPVAAVPSATLALNRLIAASQTPWSPGGGGLLDPASMTTVRGFLSAKAALPAGLPRVP
jgi:hypothetical protein